MLYKTGVEYGDYTINHVQGCAHGCKFPCYAMMMAKRFGKAMIASFQKYSANRKKRREFINGYGEYADKDLSIEELKDAFPKFAERFIAENEEYDLEGKLAAMDWGM